MLFGDERARGITRCMENVHEVRGVVEQPFQRLEPGFERSVAAAAPRLVWAAQAYGVTGSTYGTPCFASGIPPAIARQHRNPPKHRLVDDARKGIGPERGTRSTRVMS